jgi:hypothetical protein
MFITDPACEFFPSGSRDKKIHGSRIKGQKYLPTPDPGSRITDPGGQKGTGSRIRNTEFIYSLFFSLTFRRVAGVAESPITKGQNENYQLHNFKFCPPVYKSNLIFLCENVTKLFSVANTVERIENSPFS